MIYFVTLQLCETYFLQLFCVHFSLFFRKLIISITRAAKATSFSIKIREETDKRQFITLVYESHC